jgi:hypothetical protein
MRGFRSMLQSVFEISLKKRKYCEDIYNSRSYAVEIYAF